MLDSLSSEELEEWHLFYELHPFGHVRGDYQAALIAHTVASMHIKKGHRIKVEDFLLDFKPKEDKPSMSSDDIVAFMRNVAGGNA